MMKLIVADKARAGRRHAIECLNVTGRTKEGIDQSKRARAASLAIVDSPQVVQTCILKAFGLQMSCRLFSGVTCVLVRFVFVFLI